VDGEERVRNPSSAGGRRNADQNCTVWTQSLGKPDGSFAREIDKTTDIGRFLLTVIH
jgi:hypothetical protein